MSTSPPRANKRILQVFGLAALALAGLALWGWLASAPPPAKQTQAAAMTENQAKAEIARLLAELDSFKHLAGFHEAGFSGKGLLTQPAAWHTEVTALRERMANDPALPPMLRAAPGTLLGLGLEYQRSKGQETAGTKGDRDMVLEAGE